MNRGAKILQNQKKLMASIATVSMLVIVAVVYLTGGGGITRDPVSPKKIDLPVDKVDPRDYWISQVKSDQKLMHDKVGYLEKMVLESKKEQQNTLEERERLQREVFRLREDLKGSQQLASIASQESRSFDPPAVISPPRLIFHNMEEVEPEKVKNVDRMIPAGTTVKALIVSSVDASCAISASSEPHPVKLRILDDGHLPKKVRALLKGGVVIASTYGDLSSERVYMRLERLTQVKPSGDFVETDVTGFVSGEDGKYGVRGVVADRSGKLIKSAAISGFLGGASQFLQATINAQNVRDATRGLPNNIRWDLIKEGGASGLTSAMDRLSDYYIQRAEQILPVIQVAAGRVVDITFTIGTDVGDLNTKARVKEIREKSRANGEFL